MFDAAFSHYLTYGATDQQTARELTGSYNGLIVPGTVAAFQREGTGGFVLSLSATTTSPPYFIDPRFPLFQQHLKDPKQSHVALAELLGAPELIRADDPDHLDFDDDLIQRVAENWVEFNTNYATQQSAKFEKYAKRLKEEVTEEAASGPAGIIAPYVVSRGNEWWDISKKLTDATREAAASTGLPVLRVVACSTTGELDDRLGDAGDPQAVIWVSGLEELEVLPSQLAEYGEAIRNASERDQATFALYGGFFSVLMGTVGLKGACHGIGYGEHRSWPELHQSGPPPARYYAPRFHRFISQDLAYQLWLRDASLTGCGCSICDFDPPSLDYHDLMKHSVFARQKEIDGWATLSVEEARDRLAKDKGALEEDLEAAELPEPLLAPAMKSSRHLSKWVSALELLAGE